jgi:hypothetical protein
MTQLRDYQLAAKEAVKADYDVGLHRVGVSCQLALEKGLRCGQKCQHQSMLSASPRCSCNHAQSCAASDRVETTQLGPTLRSTYFIAAGLVD